MVHNQSCEIARKDFFSCVHSPFGALPLVKEERWRMAEARPTKIAEALKKTLGGSVDSSWRKWLRFRHTFGRACWHQGTKWWRRMASSAMSGKRKSTMTKVSRWACLTLMTKERGAITEMLVGDGCSCVTTEQDEPFDEQGGTGRITQSLPFCRNLSTGQKKCAIFGEELQ